MTSKPSEAGANLQTVLKELPDSYLQCRDTRHWWEETTALHIQESTPEGDVVVRFLKCTRGCETVRTDRYLLRMDRWGVQRLETQGSTYSYPEGYLLPAMAQAEHPREILRFEQMRRAMGGTVKTGRKKR